MPLETVTPGMTAEGNGLVLFVPAIANPAGPTVAELTAGTVKAITYSITGDGYSHGITSTAVKANRYSLAQEIQYDGTVVDDLEITYVVSKTTGDVVRLALPQGTSGFIVERYGYPNSTAIAAAQILDAVIPIKAGLPRPNALVMNQEITRTQRLNVSGTVYRDVVVAA
jgi:hypothetical protein